MDRWHVLKNLGEVVLRVVGRTHAALKQRQAASGVQVRSRYKRLRSSSELAASQASRLRRQASYHEVVTLYQQGKSMAAIVEQLHLSPTTVRKYIYAGAFPERATHFRRKGQLGSYLPYLERRVQEGCDNASLLWRELRDQGFSKGYKVVNTWLRGRSHGIWWIIRPVVSKPTSGWFSSVDSPNSPPLPEARLHPSATAGTFTDYPAT